ncbi:MAG TPA: M28 family peptidase [Gemmatimonadaceae bacterium]|nr:M28 family peptidase [Gemmatimonadaceae bacterium]
MDHLAALAAEPRPAGGPGADRARAYCAGVLRAHGYQVIERPFEFSALPGVFGAQAAGLWSLVTLLAASRLGMEGHPAIAVAALALGGAGLAFAARAMGRSGVLGLPVMRRRGVNLEAVRDGAAPGLWLVAHIDSKWQPVPMLLRSAGAALLVTCSGGALTLGLEQWAGAVGPGPWKWLGLLSAVASLPLLLSLVGGRNRGAVDNASGVATVLTTVELLGPTASVGVLITDAEELALAGARAWCADRRTGPGVALNCDTVDDDGTLTIMRVGGDRTRRESSEATPRVPRLVEALRSAAAADGQSARVIPLLPGVLTDSVAFAAAGWTTVTVSRGTMRTLGRIHTMRDGLAGLSGAGSAPVARVLARAVLELAQG